MMQGVNRAVGTTLTVVVISLLALGCATKQVARAPAFYPPLPEKPRLQFLTSFSGPSEINLKQNFFMKYLLGVEPSLPNIVKPYGVDIHDGTIFICDLSGDVIHKVRPGDNTWGYFAAKGGGKIERAVNIAIDTDGTRYIADVGRGQVLRFSKNDTFIDAIGRKKEMRPIDVEVDATRVYITDPAHHNVRVYAKGSHKLLFTCPGEEVGPNGAGRLFSPTNVAIDPDGRIIVADTGGFCVQIFDRDGKHVRKIGQHGDRLGQFARCKGIAADREGRIYVADAATHVIQVFDREGELLMYFGAPGEDATSVYLNLPAAITIDYDNVDVFRQYAAPGFELEYLLLVVNQYGLQKVSVFGYGHMTPDAVPNADGEPEAPDAGDGAVVDE